MRSILFLCILLFELIKSPIQSQSLPEMFISIAGLNESQKEYIYDSDLSMATVFYLVDVASNDGKYLNEEVFIRRINDKLPDREESGLAIIDWERHSINVFREYDDPLEHQRMIGQFQEAYCLAKALRPNIQWGFYGLPLRTYDGINEKWLSANDRLLPLLKSVDILAPALYIYSTNPRVYHITAPIKEYGRGDYLVDNLECFLEVAKDLEKKIYPFIWHRMNSSDNDRALRLMPLNTFKNHVQIILSTDFQDRKVDGLIWWDSQQYFHKTREKYKLLREEYEHVEDVDQYHFDLFKDYFLSIADFFK